MTEFIKISFAAILIYLLILIFRVAIAGLAYDTEKKKISKTYKGDHAGVKPGGLWGHFKIPSTIKDLDPKMTKYVTKYNRLTRLFWASYLIGIPLLILLGRELNKL